MHRPLLTLLALAASLSAAEQLRQASVARLWLKVPAGQPPLQNVATSIGTAAPASWEKDPAAREQTTDIMFPIHWWKWTEAAISFTPAHDGTVELLLVGPWAEDKNKAIVRQEILWDEIAADGTSVENGGFEAVTESGPAGWQSPWAPSLPAGSWPLADASPLAGKSLAATWHERPLSQTLSVKAGRQVRLRVHAKAATLPDFIAPKRLGGDTPAHRALSRLKRGMNLGNCWEAPPPYTWGIRYAPEDIDRIAAEGFDHIRVPVAWHFYLRQGADGLEIDPTLLRDLEPVLRRALDKKMHVLLDWHHFNDLTKDPALHGERFTAGWQTIARHFKSWPQELFFELLNEPCDALDTETVNPIHMKTIAAIRAIDPERLLVVSPGNYGNASELDLLRLPDGDGRIVVTIHCYDPFYFTHQGADWSGLQALRGITYPGPPEKPVPVPEALRENTGVRAFLDGYNTLPPDRNPCSPRVVQETLDGALAWSRHFGRPLHLGEFGNHNVADAASRGRHLRDVRSLAEARKIPWTLWEWKSVFGYWDAKNNRPLFRSSLFE